jgi:hypothetical protein
MIAEHNYGAHSAQVEMRLIINGKSIGITHMGRDFVLVESPIDHVPGEASIFMKVDDSEASGKSDCRRGFRKIPSAWRSRFVSNRAFD